MRSDADMRERYARPNAMTRSRWHAGARDDGVGCMSDSAAPAVYRGIDPAYRAAMLRRGTDDGGNPIEPFVDTEGDWPLRCCLRTSRAGEKLAIVALRPFAWDGPYAETGPVVIHAGGCEGSDGSFPERFERKDQILRAYGRDEGREHTQVYGLGRLVPAGTGLRTAIEQALRDPRVDEVHVRNVVSGCYSFAARRVAGSAEDPAPGVAADRG